MISAIAICDRTGDILAMRRFRKDFDLVALDNYRIGVIAARETNTPAVIVDETSFLHYHENEVYYVGVTRQNANAGLIFEFLGRLPHIFCQVLNLQELKVNDIRLHVPEIIELLDEMVDSGYPQNTDPESLRLLTQRPSTSSKSDSGPQQSATIQATGAVPWRTQGINYRTNEIFVDVVEKVSLLVSAAGKVLDASVNGVIQMKTYLTGMPECKIGFNDKVSVESEGAGAATRTGSSIEVDDMVFHQCVKLGDFASGGAISFIPPDGEFELMKYRKTENVGIPFTITPMVRDLPGNSLEIRVNIRAAYDAKLSANPLLLQIPLPENTSSVECSSTTGKGKYVPEQNSVVWKATAFPGKSSAEITINVKCLAATSKASPATKINNPISAEFNIPMFSASGLALRYLKVVEKSGYTPDKWLRYVTKHGKYEVRMV